MPVFDGAVLVNIEEGTVDLKLLSSFSLLITIIISIILIIIIIIMVCVLYCTTVVSDTTPGGGTPLTP